MNVAILHCHFRRGGVTQVVENHVASLTGLTGGKIVLVSGGRNDGLSVQTTRQTETLCIEDLDYDDVIASKTVQSALNLALPDRARCLTNEIVAGLAALGMDSSDTVLHWHNHSLGKNLAVPIAIQQLAGDHGFHQLLQIHDFAEDFRPENFWRIVQAAKSLGMDGDLQDSVNQMSYPSSPLIHYATLTSGDAEVLDGIGIDPNRVHLVPNCVTLGTDEAPDAELARAKIREAASLPSDARWIVYPVRGIRRKNLGEFLLLSQLSSENTFLGVTLPPATPIENQSYERWRGVGTRVAPRAIFDAGTYDGVSFHENLAASEFILSTSVAEGFGMAFLEPWLAGRGVVARRLPNVVDDFVAAGVQLDRFYDSVCIPGQADWIRSCRRESEDAFSTAWGRMPELFGGDWSVGRIVDEAQDEWIDFATLTTSRQIEVLKRVSDDDGFRSAIIQCNDALVGWLEQPFERSVLNANAASVASKYSLAESGAKLSGIYQALAVGPSNAGQNQIPLNRTVSVVSMICGERTYYPCRTELEIET